MENKTYPKYVYANVINNFYRIDSNARIRDCAPFSSKADMGRHPSDNVFFAIRIEPKEPLDLYPMECKTDYGSHFRDKTIIKYDIMKGKLNLLSEFNAMPMVLIGERWVEKPELCGVKVSKWNNILNEQGLYSYPEKGYGTNADIDRWFEEDEGKRLIKRLLELTVTSTIEMTVRGERLTFHFSEKPEEDSYELYAEGDEKIVYGLSCENLTDVIHVLISDYVAGVIKNDVKIHHPSDDAKEE